MSERIEMQKMKCVECALRILESKDGKMNSMDATHLADDILNAAKKIAKYVYNLDK